MRNRDRIVSAAREMFVEYGPDVPLDEIARRAGLSNATVYRHFSDRAELVRSVVLFVMKRTADKAKRAVREDTDSFEALRCFVHAAADQRIWALCPTAIDRFVHRDLQLFPDGLQTPARSVLPGRAATLEGLRRTS